MFSVVKLRRVIVQNDALGPLLPIGYHLDQNFKVCTLDTLCRPSQTPKHTTFSMFSLLVGNLRDDLISGFICLGSTTLKPLNRLPFKLLGAREVELVWMEHGAICFFQAMNCLYIEKVLVPNHWLLFFSKLNSSIHILYMYLFLCSYFAIRMVPVLFGGIGSPSVSPASAASSHSASPSCASEGGSVGQLPY